MKKLKFLATPLLCVSFSASTVQAAEKPSWAFDEAMMKLAAKPRVSIEAIASTLSSAEEAELLDLHRVAQRFAVHHFAVAENDRYHEIVNAIDELKSSVDRTMGKIIENYEKAGVEPNQALMAQLRNTLIGATSETQQFLSFRMAAEAVRDPELERYFFEFHAKIAEIDSLKIVDSLATSQSNVFIDDVWHRAGHGTDVEFKNAVRELSETKRRKFFDQATGKTAIIEAAGGRGTLLEKLAKFSKVVPTVAIAIGLGSALVHDSFGDSGYSNEDFSDGLLADPNGF